jgi:hypothetical protein
MKGGESFGINNISFGNIIIALNNYKFYIKLQYTDESDEDKNGVYYFIFDLKDNDIITSYGFTNKILVNGNLDIRNSKTFLDLDLNKSKEYELFLKGKAYKSLDNSTAEISFNEKDGIPSGLEIALAQNEVPKYILTFGIQQKQEIPGKGERNLPKECTLDDLKTYIKDQKSSIEEYNKDKKDDNKDLVVENQLKLFTCITFLIDSMDTPTITEVYNLLNDTNNLILDDTNRSSYTGILSNLTRKIKSIDKTILTPVKAPLQQSNQQIGQQTNQQKQVKKKVDEVNKDLLLSDNYTPKIKEKLVETLNNIISNKDVSQKAYNYLFGKLIQGNYMDSQNKINEMGKVIANAYRRTIINLVKNKKMSLQFNSATGQKPLNFSTTYSSIINVLEAQNIKTIDELDSNWNTLLPSIVESILSIKKGGATENCKVILENNEDDIKNISEFGEPIIYIDNNKSNIVGLNSKYNKIPVFGYLTVGKQLMLILLELQTNQRVSFKQQQTRTEKAKAMLYEFAMRNPAAAAGFATILANGVTKILIESGIPGLRDIPHVKDLVTKILSGLVGDWVAPYLTTWLPSADRNKTGIFSFAPGEPTSAYEAPSGITSSAINSSSNSTTTLGGKMKKSRKSTKKSKRTRKTKKNRKK